MPDSQVPSLHLAKPSSTPAVLVAGAWRVQMLASAPTMHGLRQQLSQFKPAQWLAQEWDLRGLTELDHLGAQMLWNAWGQRLPAKIEMHASHEAIFEHLAAALDQPLKPEKFDLLQPIQALGSRVIGFFEHLYGILLLLGQLVLDVGHLCRHPRYAPWKEISANIYRAGFQALGITALVGMLIGIVLSYLSAQQLRNFGADAFIVNMLGISIIRELGPMLAAILVAGRSGSAITAQLGVMRVTEELDAMLVMGIAHGYRLVLPKVLALAIAMPLLVIWTDAAALFGGMLAASLELGITPEFFLAKLRDVVPLINYWIGLGKGVVFGILIALVACHFGMRIKPNTDSLGRGTTSSVVTAITVVIFADAVFAIAFRGIGVMF